ncbi:MAG: response regulator transcription factor [Anaerolineae bacterium]|jgi:DNA-binding NarL/FixJ family response regulator|nr:response regulator transcription factor [Anaerolineae bacterium]
MITSIKVAILEDHQSIIDGYIYRLGMVPDIQIVGTGLFGDDLEPLLAQHQVNVLLLDLSLPISAENNNIFPIRHELPNVFAQYPSLKVIVISVFEQPALVRAMIKLGAHGYIVKEDQNSIKNLARIVKVVAGGGIFLSSDLKAYISLADQDELLTPRQIEALSLCVAYPDMTASILAQKMNISSSTFRNILSGAYQRLEVRTRNAAVRRVEEMGIILRKTSSTQHKRKKTGLDHIWRQLDDI